MNPLVRNWKNEEPIPTSWGLYDVDMISVTEGWAVSHPITGDHAYILHTINGGKTWQRQGGLFSQLSGISFADALHGVAVGNEYRFMLDGGRTNQATGVFASVSVYAVSPTVAWIGGLEDLGRTTNSGATWTIEQTSDTDWFCMTFLNGDNGWAGGQDQTIDDVPGRIWKRSSSASAAIEKLTTVERGSRVGSGVWQAPPSRSATEPDATNSRLTTKEGG